MTRRSHFTPEKHRLLKHLSKVCTGNSIIHTLHIKPGFLSEIYVPVYPPNWLKVKFVTCVASWISLDNSDSLYRPLTSKPKYLIDTHDNNADKIQGKGRKCPSFQLGCSHTGIYVVSKTWVDTLY